jgi:hypothetical protein
VWSRSALLAEAIASMRTLTPVMVAVEGSAKPKVVASRSVLWPLAGTL